MRSKEEKPMSLWTMIARLFPQIASVSPGLFILNYTCSFIDSILLVGAVVYMQKLFDSVANLATNKGTLEQAILALLTLFVIKVLKEVEFGIYSVIGETYYMKSTGKLSHNINLKMAKLDPISFENPEILDHIDKSYLGTRNADGFINTIMDVLTAYIPYYIFMGAYLFSLKPILVVSLLLIFLPVLLSQLVRAKVFADLEDKTASFRRKSDYYESCIVGREYVKETRILGGCSYFMGLFKDALTQMNSLKWKADMKMNLIEFAMKFISLVGYLGILWMLFSILINKEITVGAFAAVFASIDSMFATMEEMICNRLGYFAESFGKIQNYLRFLDLPERDYSDYKHEKTVHGDISLKDVSFAYPLADKNAVENINLEIHKGETIAVVGENGSGKSTLIRLITGIYLPKTGTVFHNKKATNEFASRDLFQGVSAVFQKFQRYQLSFEDNVTISEMGDKYNTEENLKHSVTQAGIDMDINTFKNGYDTMLSREFDGIDLSGGQWQKIAIARGFYRQHELIILDEPTAAIDPIEETKIYERFAEISKEKTAVIVTHRLGSVKFAHRIVVMKEGRIVGIGSHDELILSCPLYADMWKSQSQYYTEPELIL
ncbi:MAG: ABC transporter ATP-binding protein [Clostridium sp.]|uniref:ABC transporter ATP-binding protein n=1 Tax=Clostridium sp. TaxID=1506 RepID=UPI003039D0B3